MPEFTLFNIAGLGLGFMAIGVTVGIIWEVISPKKTVDDTKAKKVAPAQNQHNSNSQPPQTTAATIKPSVKR